MNPSDNEKLKINNEWEGITKKSAIAFVRQSGFNLRKLPPEFRNDKDVVLVAVKDIGFMLEYVSTELRNDHDVVFEAVKRHSYALKYASSELQNNCDIVLEAIKLGTPSFMGKANDENILSISLEAISKHLSLLWWNDLNFLYVSKTNFPILEREVESMGWYNKIFSEEAKNLRMMKKLYRERISIIMERIRKDDEYHKEQTAFDLEKVRRKEEYESYIRLRAEIEKMPISQRWKKEVKKKCEDKCQICGSNKNLEVHHCDSFCLILKQNNINSIEKAFECKQLWNIDNGEVLCKECHDKMESSKNRQSIIAGI